MSEVNRRAWAVVTGASGGIGERLAYAFAMRGWNVVLAARSPEKLNTVRERCARLGARTKIVRADLRTEVGARRLTDFVHKQGLDVGALVNNAGIGASGAFLEGARHAHLGVIDLNLRTLTDLTHWFGARFTERGEGGVLNVASTAAFQPGPGMAVYYATKAYVLSLSEALNHEWKGTGLWCTALCPGPTQSDFFEHGVMNDTRLAQSFPRMTAEQVARAGVEAFLKRRPVIVPGLLNTAMARLAAWAPRALILPVVAKLHATGHEQER